MRAPSLRLWVGVSAFLLVFVVAGCFAKRQAEVEGTVTYDGQPLGVGNITFIPTSGDEKAGAVKRGGRIESGHYKLEFDPVPGEYRVEVRWSKPTGKTYKNEFGDTYPVAQEGLPDKYHANSTLTATLKSGKNVVD